MEDYRIGLEQNQILCLDDESGTNHYSVQIWGEAGRGASCIVYRACIQTGERPDRPVLLKEFYPVRFSALLTRDHAGLRFRTEEPDLLERYLREKAQFLRLLHLQKDFYRQNASDAADELVEIQVICPKGESIYAVMPAGSGISWDRIDPPEESLEDILQTILSVLSETQVYHRFGYLHCDIKPANIYLFRKTRQHIRLLDFGSVQKLVDGRLTGAEELSFSARYCAPELLDTLELDPIDRQDYYTCITPKADVYAIAAVLYGKLTGQKRPPEMPDRLFRTIVCQQLEQVWERHCRGWLQNVRRSAFMSLQELLCRGLARDPENRFSLSEMTEEVRRYLPLFQEPQYTIASSCHAAGASGQFVGREKEMEQLRQLLELGIHTIFITGDGGLGKSELALQLAARESDQYRFFRIPFRGDLEQTVLDIPIDPVPPQEEATDIDQYIFQREERYQFKLQCLRSYTRYNVLVIDQFDIPPDQASQIFHSRAYGDLTGLDMRLIFTTRAIFHEGDAQVRIQPLPEQDLLRLFRMHYKGAASDQSLLPLIRQVCSNTLLTEVLARSMEQSWGGMEPKTVCAMLQTEEEGMELLHRQLRKLYDVTVLDAASRELMAQAALFPDGGLYARACLLCHPERMQDKLRLLELSGWLRKTGNNQLMAHPLVQDVLREDLDKWEKACKRFALQYELQIGALPNEQQLWHRPGLAELMSNVADLLPDPEGRSAEKAASLNYEAGRYAQALRHNQQLWTVICSNVDLSPQRGLEVLDRVAVCYCAVGDYSNAILLESQGIHLFRKLIQEETVQLGRCYENLGTMYKQQGSYSEAFISYQKAEQIFAEQKEESAMAHLWVNLCKLCEKCGYLQEASRYGKQALTHFARQSCGRQQEILAASVYTTLGILQEHGGDYREALAHYEQAASIYERVYGTQHPNTANIFNSKGIALSYLGEYSQALSFLEAARKIKEAVPGVPPDSMANTYHSLADLYRMTGDTARAMDWCEKAETIRVDRFRADSLQAAWSYELKAAILCLDGQYEQALSYGVRALYIYHRVFGGRSDVREIRQSRQNLIAIYRASGRDPEGLPGWLEQYIR